MAQVIWNWRFLNPVDQEVLKFNVSEKKNVPVAMS
jgi:hypothetical protein